MSVLSIISSWQKGEFKPVYWLEGDEDYFINEVMEYAEKKILPETEAAFNLSVFYGKDSGYADIVNACRRYPVFAKRQVVLLKEAQRMRDLEKLEPYFQKPAVSTLLVIAYKGKTLDKRTRVYKTIKKTSEILTSKKLYDNQLPAWTNGYIQSRGFKIAPKALALLVDHVGNDLSRITNEVNKLALNLSNTKSISEDDIEKYIGISKEYNVFELSHAFSTKNRAKAISIIRYFESNPKAAPVQMILPALYGFFTRIMPLYQMADRSDRVLRPLFYNNPEAIFQAKETLKNYTSREMEKIILLLHHYNLKTIGINSHNVSSASLLKELSFKIMEGE